MYQLYCSDNKVVQRIAIKFSLRKPEGISQLCMKGLKVKLYTHTGLLSVLLFVHKDSFN